MSWCLAARWSQRQRVLVQSAAHACIWVGDVGGGREGKIVALYQLGFEEGTCPAAKPQFVWLFLLPPLREKDDKYKTWMPKFLMSRDEKDRRKSSDDVDRSLLALSVFPVLSDFVWGVSWCGSQVTCRSRMPLLKQTLVFGCCSRVLLLWTQLLETLWKVFWRQNKFLDLSCVQVEDTLRVSSWRCMWSSCLDETKKVFLAMHWAAFLLCSAPFLPSSCLD